MEFPVKRHGIPRRRGLRFGERTDPQVYLKARDGCRLVGPPFVVTVRAATSHQKGTRTRGGHDTFLSHAPARGCSRKRVSIDGV